MDFFGNCIFIVEIVFSANLRRAVGHAPVGLKPISKVRPTWVKIHNSWCHLCCWRRSNQSSRITRQAANIQQETETDE
jgi:hypothetical protein